MMAASYICNRIPRSALNMETLYKKLYGKDANISHLKIIGAGAFVHIKSLNKLGHTSWEGMMCGFSETESNSYRIWNPKPRRVVESRNVVFIETPPNLLSTARQLSPQQDLESPSYDFSDDNYVSHGDMLWDVQNYTSALDFGVDTPAGTVEFIMPQQASPGENLPGGASSAGILPGRVTPEGSSPPSTPTPACVAPRATNGHANRGGSHTHRYTQQATSLLSVPVATCYGGGRNNNRESLAELLEAGTLQHLSELGLGPPCYTEGIVHQAKSASFNV